MRDAATRGYTAAQTLARWESVKRGEKLNIFPYQENSDAIFNSALVHEMAVLRPLAEPLLLQVRPTPRSMSRPTGCCRSCSGSARPSPPLFPTTAFCKSLSIRPGASWRSSSGASRWH